jgi:hypothetical protein
MLSLAGIEAEILFYEERVKKIAANSLPQEKAGQAVQMFINVMKYTLPKNRYEILDIRKKNPDYHYNNRD